MIAFSVVLPCTFRPRPLNLEPLRFVFVSTIHLYNTGIIQLQSALDDEYNNFLGNTKPVPHFRANNWKAFSKNYSQTFTLEQFH